MGRLQTLLLVVVVVVVVVVGSAHALHPDKGGVAGAIRAAMAEKDCCLRPFPLSAFCTQCWGACPQRVGGLDRLSEVLRSRVFGQDESIERLVEALGSDQQDKPLVIHIAGDNGVGKTLTAKTVAEALFSVKDSRTGVYKGLLYLRGNSYVTDENIAEMREDLLRTVAVYLEQCPRAVIVFDEAELPHPEVMQAFEILFDNTVGTVRLFERDITVKDATFILISDFGASPGGGGGGGGTATMDALQTYIQNDVDRVWATGKQSDRINHIVPFLPLDTNTPTAPEGVVDMTTHLLTTLGAHLPALARERGVTLGFDPRAQFAHSIEPPTLTYLYDSRTEQQYGVALAQCLFDRLRQPGSLYANRNYRGIEQLFHHAVGTALTRFVRSADLHNTAVADMSLVIGLSSQYLSGTEPVQQPVFYGDELPRFGQHDSSIYGPDNTLYLLLRTSRVDGGYAFAHNLGCKFNGRAYS